MPGEMSIVLSEDGADAERLDRLTGYLRQELAGLDDVDQVTAAAAELAPPGSRGLDVAAVGALLVQLSGSAGALKDVITAVRAWLSRGDGVRRTVRIELGGNSLELSEASRADQNRLVDLFVQRHGGD